MTEMTAQAADPPITPSPLGDLAERVARQARFYESPSDFRSGVHAACDAVAEVIDDHTAHAVTARLGVITHEVGTPLSVIVGALETLSDRGDDLTDEQRDVVVRAAKRHMAHLRYLLDRLMIADEENGGFPVDLQSVELGTLTIRIVEDLTPAISDRAVRIEIHDRDLPKVAADPQAVRRILAALVSNADKYSPPDGPIDISVGTTDHVVSVQVSDKGAGIPESERDTVFAKGRRLGHGEAPGSGLGLYLARGLAKAQGGRLEISGRTDGESGTSVTLHLPLASD